MSTEAVIRARGLKKVYGSGHTAVHAVRGVDLDIDPGEIVLIMGPSGSGKTTLLSMLGGLLKPSAGGIYLDGQALGSLEEVGLAQVRATKLGFMFQAFNLLSSLRVEENIVFPATLAGEDAEAAAARAEVLMARLGLTERRRFLPRDLSGGEKQRVAIARALINEPSVILADEPTGNLDTARGQEVLMLLHDIARDEGRAVLIVTHDPRVEEIADRILWLEDGELRDRKGESHDLVRDVVCGMRVDPWTARISTKHQGVVYHFCSQRCQERFAEDPASYTASGGTT